MNEQDLQRLFEPAKKIRLTPEERAVIRAKLVHRTQGDGLVRAEGSDRQRGTDMPLLPDHFAAKARSVSLNADEKRIAFDRLRSFMDRCPPAVPAVESLLEEEREEPPADGFWYAFVHFLRLPAIAVVILMLTGGSLAYAAEDTLPGDLLYPFKRYVSENVWQQLSLSAESKAWWEARRAERRLEELEDLATHQRLQAETGRALVADFDAYSARVRDRILQLRARGDDDKAAELFLHFASSVDAHAGVLESLSRQLAKNADLASMLAEMEGKLESEEDDHVAASETKIVVENPEVQQQEAPDTAALQAQREAQRQVRQARSFVFMVREELPPDELKRVEERLTIAERLLEESKDHLDEQATLQMYRSVQSILRDVKMAQRMAQLKKNMEENSTEEEQDESATEEAVTETVVDTAVDGTEEVTTTEVQERPVDAPSHNQQKGHEAVEPSVEEEHREKDHPALEVKEDHEDKHEVKNEDHEKQDEVSTLEGGIAATVETLPVVEEITP